MPLQFIFGPSGGGKSHYLYQTVVEEAAKDRTKDFLIIVPEQFTMQTQKELVERSERHAIMNIDVLSFERLAFRVFDELGMYQIHVLEETGKNLILRKLAKRCEGQMHVLGNNFKKMGYINEVKSLISEFMQYQVTPEDLESWVGDEDNPMLFRMKMQDVQVLYHEFKEYLRGSYVTSEEVLQECAKAAERSKMLKGCCLAFDGFTGFTPVQVKLLETLFPMAERIWATVTLDQRCDPYQKARMQDLFYMSAKMVQALLELADGAGCEVLEPIRVEEGKDYRFASSLALRHLEENLFRPHANIYPQKTEEISISCLSSPKEELTYAAAKISELVREEGFRYRDFAIVSGAIETYANYAKEVFSTYQIPYFVDAKRTILLHPFVEFLRASLEMVEEDFSYESVMRYFRTGLSLQDAEEVDRLENYLLASGIRGWKNWRQPFQKCPRGYGEDALQALNAIREQFLGPASYLRDAMHPKDATVAERTEALYRYVLMHRIEERLDRRREAFEEAGNHAKAKEYEQIFGIVIDLFDKMVDLMGDEPISLEEYADLLDAGYEAAKVGVIPPGHDCVVLGDIERTRLEDIQILFFAGVNDGIIPKASDGGGILSGMEREALLEKEIRLSPTPRERTFIQKFYLYLNLTKPQKKLILTYARVNAQGQATRASYLVSQLRKLFPALEISEDYGKELTLATPTSSLSFFLDGISGEGLAGEDLLEWGALARWYQEHWEWRLPTQELLDQAFASYQGERLPQELVHGLYGQILKSSVTRLEQFAACACAHFLRFGLGLDERCIAEFTPADFGNVFHDAIEDFSRKLLEAGIGWGDLGAEMSLRLEEESFQASLEKNHVEQNFDSQKNRFFIRQMRSVYHRTIATLTEQVKRGKFLPSGFEVIFSPKSHPDSMRFALGPQESMDLRGRIDRIDTYENGDKVYVRIIDYKTGHAEFSLINLYHGLQLQLVAYLNAAIEGERRKHPGKEALPGGIFYYHVDDPYLEGKQGMSEEEVAKALLEQLKLDGIVNSEPEVYRAMDEGMGSDSSIIPVKLKKDNSHSASSRAFSEEAFAMIGEFANQKMTQLGKAVMGGDILPEPYLQEKRSGCDFCPYQSVCGFDAKIPGYHYKKIAKGIKDEEALATIVEELQSGPGAQE